MHASPTLTYSSKLHLHGPFRALRRKRPIRCNIMALVCHRIIECCLLCSIVFWLFGDLCGEVVVFDSDVGPGIVGIS